METLISKVFDQSLSVGIMLVVFWYQRQDRKELLTMIEKNATANAELKSAMAENRSLLERILNRLENAR